jgi:hypothetical protein
MTRFHVTVRLYDGQNTINFTEAKRRLLELFTSMNQVSPKARLDVFKTESYSFAKNGSVVKLECINLQIAGMELTVMESFIDRYGGLLKIPDSSVSIFYDKHEHSLA